MSHTFFSRPGLLEKLANTSSENVQHGAEVAGLGVLAAPSAVEKMQQLGRGAKVTGSRVGKYLTSHGGKTTTELAGLGILAAPSVAHFMKGNKTAGLDSAHLFYFFNEMKNG